MTVSEGHQPHVLEGLACQVVARRGELELDVSISVARGEVVAVLGPNGAGKTTWLRAICGLLPLRTGRVVLNGTVFEDTATLTTVPTEKRPIGLVFQDALLFPHLSVLDNVAFGLRAASVPRAEARRRAAEMLAPVGLTDVASRPASALSGGQAQRVALLRALARGPELLLLDEPLSALDVVTRAEVRRDLRQHLTSFGGPSIVVTHDLIDATTIADRLVILEAGRIVQHGAPDEVLAHPATDFVATLVGMNLLRGTAHDGQVRLDGGGTLRIEDASKTGRVVLAVHPSVLRASLIDPEALRDVTPTWETSVTAVERTHNAVEVTVAGGSPVRISMTAPAFHQAPFDIDDRVSITVDPAEISVAAEVPCR